MTLSRRHPASLARPRRILPLGLLAALVVVTALALWNAGTALVLSRVVVKPDAIVSLASHEWERLPMAARLATESPTALVLLTLPQPLTTFNCHDCGSRVDRLRRMGVHPSRIRILPLTHDGTYGEALATYAYARQEGLQRLVVVTSPYHTRRALATFRRVFDGSPVEIGIQPASETSPAQPTRWWRTPYDRWYVRYEWVAVAYYSIRYGINPLATLAAVSQGIRRS